MRLCTGHAEVDELPRPEIVSPDITNVDTELVERTDISKYLTKSSSIDSRVSGYEILDNGPDSAVFSIDLEQLIVNNVFIQLDPFLSKNLRIPLL